MSYTSTTVEVDDFDIWHIKLNVKYEEAVRADHTPCTGHVTVSP
jgi:hypothetical protein